MYELPNAKRVKRSKLFSSMSSSEDEMSDTEPDAVNTKISKAKSKIHENSTVKGQDPDQDDNAQPMQVDYGFDYEFVDKIEPSASTSASTKPRSRPSSKSSKSQTDSGTQSTELEPPETRESAEQTYAFNLFAPKPKPTSLPQPSEDAPSNQDPTPTQSSRITIRSPTPASATDLTSTAHGRMLKPRPTIHYFTSALPPSVLTTLQSQYADTAISPTTLLSLSTKSWPGTSLPWRVLSIPRSKLTLIDPTATIQPRTASTTRSRPRPSKKRRIMLRQRRAAREAVKVASQRDEEAEREKRTRRNREKKVKKKMREKAKKAASAAGVGVGGNGDGDGEGEDVDDRSDSVPM